MKIKRRLFASISTIVFLFTGCSSDSDSTGDADITAPKIFIQSPGLILNYSTDVGNSNVPYKVIFKAQGADETNISSLKLIVTDNKGNIVLKKINVNDSDSESILDIYESFETTVAGQYKAEFIAVDKSGNKSSELVIFTYED